MASALHRRGSCHSAKDVFLMLKEEYRGIFLTQHTQFNFHSCDLLEIPVLENV